MQINDRVQELRRVKASDLKPHPRNWRTHPAAQQDALRGVLAEIGFADALLVRELNDGSLQLIDGHLRAETMADGMVPVLVVDLTDEEADKVLLTHDPLAAMAGIEEDALHSLLAEAETESDAVRQLLDDLAKQTVPDFAPINGPDDSPEVDIPALHQVVIECQDESEQQHLFERMRGEGFKCRVLTL